jgi:hypothetical protein
LTSWYWCSPEGDLVQVVAAADPVGRRPDLLDGRQQQPDEDRDDRDDDEQLDEREGAAGHGGSSPAGGLPVGIV